MNKKTFKKDVEKVEATIEVDDTSVKPFIKDTKTDRQTEQSKRTRY